MIQNNTSPQVEIVKQYISLAESMNFSADTTAEILHSEYQQWELPNQLNKSGQKSDAADSYRRMQIAKTIMKDQKYQVTSAFEHGSTVIIEAIWTGKLAIDAGTLKAGQQMKAFFCMIFEFKDHKIYRVRNYDCFEPF